MRLKVESSMLGAGTRFTESSSQKAQSSIDRSNASILFKLRLVGYSARQRIVTIKYQDLIDYSAAEVRI